MGDDTFMDTTVVDVGQYTTSEWGPIGIIVIISIIIIIT